MKEKKLQIKLKVKVSKFNSTEFVFFFCFALYAKLYISKLRYLMSNLSCHS